MTRIVTKLTVTIGIYFARSTTIRMTSPSPRIPLLTGTPLATRLMRGPAPPRCLHLAPTWQAHMAPSTPAAHLTGSACMMLCAPLERPIFGVQKYLWPTNLTSPNGAIMRIVSRTRTCRIYWHTAFPWTTLPLISHIRSLAITRQQHIILNTWFWNHSGHSGSAWASPIPFQNKWIDSLRIKVVCFSSFYVKMHTVSNKIKSCQFWEICWCVSHFRSKGFTVCAWRYRFFCHAFCRR